MLFWLLDRALLINVLLAMLACGLLLRWWATRRGSYLIAASAILGLAAFIFLLTQLIITDRQRLELNVREMANGVLEGNPEAVFKHLASDFTMGNWRRADFIRNAEATIRRRGISDLHLWDFDVEQLSRIDRKAVLAFRVRAESRWGNVFALCRAHFIFDGAAWKMRELQAFNAVANTKQPLNIPLP